MMTIQEAFKAQLDGGTPSDGTYNGATTVDQVVAALSGSIMGDGIDLVAHAEKKLKEFAEHKGERHVFFLAPHQNGIQVLSVWENDIEELSNEYDLADQPFDMHPGQIIPRFVKKA